MTAKARNFRAAAKAQFKLFLVIFGLLKIYYTNKRIKLTRNDGFDYIKVLLGSEHE
jgi:hypothetical protein